MTAATRRDIYYWKCDSPLSVEAKRQVYFKDKYRQRDLTGQITRIVADWQGEAPERAAPSGADGNHFAYLITMRDGRRWFFRGDEGLLDDDYLIAEGRVLEELRPTGIPVPRVWLSGGGTDACPVRFQILDYIDAPCLNVYYKEGALDVPAIAAQLGGHLRRLHRLSYPGFGFFDTERVRRDGALVGLDAAYLDYFYKRFDTHLGYLVDHALISREDAAAITAAFRRHEWLLARERGVLVHRDMALWNVLGTPGEIMAIVDWDDCVVGDPADDLGIIACFHDDDFMAPLLQAYSGGEPVAPEFLQRIRLHTLRNMLWKTMIRHYMGYFEKDGSFFLNNRGTGHSLREFTLNRLLSTLKRVNENGM